MGRFANPRPVRDSVRPDSRTWPHLGLCGVNRNSEVQVPTFGGFHHSDWPKGPLGPKFQPPCGPSDPFWVVLGLAPNHACKPSPVIPPLPLPLSRFERLSAKLRGPWRRNSLLLIGFAISFFGPQAVQFQGSLLHLERQRGAEKAQIDFKCKCTAPFTHYLNIGQCGH